MTFECIWTDKTSEMYDREAQNGILSLFNPCQSMFMDAMTLRKTSQRSFESLGFVQGLRMYTGRSLQSSN